MIMTSMHDYLCIIVGIINEVKILPRDFVARRSLTMWPNTTSNNETFREEQVASFPQTRAHIVT
jgi:hypothetical protein